MQKIEYFDFHFKFMRKNEDKFQGFTMVDEWPLTFFQISALHTSC